MPVFSCKKEKQITDLGKSVMGRFTCEMAQHVETTTDAWACTRHFMGINHEVDSFCVSTKSTV